LDDTSQYLVTKVESIKPGEQKKWKREYHMLHLDVQIKLFTLLL